MSQAARDRLASAVLTASNHGARIATVEVGDLVSLLGERAIREAAARAGMPAPSDTDEVLETERPAAPPLSINI